jgi:hypothetical protein
MKTNLTPSKSNYQLSSTPKSLTLSHHSKSITKLNNHSQYSYYCHYKNAMYMG